MKMVRPLLLICLVLCMIEGNLFAQASADSSLSNTLRIFTRSAGDQSPIYNGVQYRRYPDFIHYGQPFFVADSLMAGTVTYDGLTYENVRLMLDEVNDELITTDWQGDNLVQLSKDHVQAFTIGDFLFVNIAAKDMKPGYYRELYNGRSHLLIRESKSIQVKTGRTNAETERSVNAGTDYYLKTNKGYQRFGRLSQLLSMFGDKRENVARYIKENKLKRSTREELFLRATAFYDQLNR